MDRPPARARGDVRAGLAQALAENGMSIIATDDFSWKEREKWSETLVAVLEMEATAAVREHPDAEVLLCAWPYMEDAFSRACGAWGPGRSIVYVGEGVSGCCANDAFFDGFVDDEDGPIIELLTWPGIHDGVHTGRWSQAEHDRHLSPSPVIACRRDVR